LRRSWKFLVGIAVYNLVLVLIIAYGTRDAAGAAGISFSFMLGNIVEELLFRATLIPLFEILERKLLGSSNQTRAVAASSLAFSMMHIQQYVNATVPLDKFIAVENMAIAFVIGMFLGKVYLRSRNLPSVIGIHWWINLQNRVLQYLVMGLLR
jgi:membrane protease YdiL (CAAX protease family)